VSTDTDACCQAADGTYLLGTYINESGVPLPNNECGINVKLVGISRAIQTKTEIVCSSEVICYECIPSISTSPSLEPTFVELCDTLTFLGFDCCDVYQWLILQHVHIKATVSTVFGDPHVEVIVEHRYAVIEFVPISWGACANLPSIQFWVLTDQYLYTGPCDEIPATLEHVDRQVTGSSEWPYDTTKFTWGSPGSKTYTFCDPLEISLVY
jgi:hypothetical protein